MKRIALWLACMFRLQGGKNQYVKRLRVEHFGQWLKKIGLKYA